MVRILCNDRAEPLRHTTRSIYAHELGPARYACACTYGAAGQWPGTNRRLMHPNYLYCYIHLSATRKQLIIDPQPRASSPTHQVVLTFLAHCLFGIRWADDHHRSMRRTVLGPMGWREGCVNSEFDHPWITQSRRGSGSGPATYPSLLRLGSSGCCCMDSTAPWQRWLNRSRQDHLLFWLEMGLGLSEYLYLITSIAMIARFLFHSLKNENNLLNCTFGACSSISR